MGGTYAGEDGYYSSYHPQHECKQAHTKAKASKNCRYDVNYQRNMQEFVICIMECLLGLGKERDVAACRIAFGLEKL
jgi:hypothetical protein